MAAESFVTRLNEQIGNEFAAAHQYVAIGAYYASETFPQLSAHFYAQAEEEREHAMKMVNYLIDRGVQPDIGGVEAPRGTFGDQAGVQGHGFETDPIGRRVLRLEHEGVLVSWALPKGVPETGSKNHLAVQTEDHPMDYADFEGVRTYVERRHREAESDTSRERFEGFMREVPCPACGGALLRR